MVSIRFRSVSEAVASARQLGGPVALKLDAGGVAHKSDVAGVALGLVDDDAVYVAALSMLEGARRRGLEVHGLLVQPMAKAGPFVRALGVPSMRMTAMIGIGLNATPTADGRRSPIACPTGHPF